MATRTKWGKGANWAWHDEGPHMSTSRVGWLVLYAAATLLVGRGLAAGEPWRAAATSGRIEPAGGAQHFKAPFEGEAVLYLETADVPE